MNIITVNLNPHEGKPLYLQLYDYIKKEIQSKTIPYNTKLPSKRILSAHLQVSQNTVQNAYDQLISEGYITPKARSGFFVAKLEEIINLDIKGVSEELEKTKTSPYKYDFSHQGVDMEFFPFSTWKKLTKEVINKEDLELLTLGDSKGHVKLRSSIAEYLHQSRGVNCDEEQIIISAGTEFLFQLLIQLLGKDNVYALENPGYEKLNMVFKTNGAKYRSVNVDESGMSIKELSESGANIPCVAPSHQFPLGIIRPINRRIQLLNWAKEAENRYIIEDDYDSEFKFSGKPIPALQGIDDGGKVIYMGAFSKSLTPSIRISYMVLPKPLMKIYKKNLSFYVCPVPTIEQKVLHNFIQGGYFERHLNRMRNIYKKKREVLVSSITETTDKIEIIGANAGLHLLLKVKNGMAEQELISSAEDYGIKVYNLSSYYINESNNKIESTVLIGFSTLTIEEIREGVKLLLKAWNLRNL